MAQLDYKPPARLGCCPEGMCFDEAKIIAEERERCAKIVRRICGETCHVKLGDAIETAIRA